MSSVLLIGLKGLGNEIAKNLVLAGVGSLTVVDDDPVVEADLDAQFFVSEESVGQMVSMEICAQHSILMNSAFAGSSP